MGWARTREEVSPESSLLTPAEIYGAAVSVRWGCHSANVIGTRWRWQGGDRRRGEVGAGRGLGPAWGWDGDAMSSALLSATCELYCPPAHPALTPQNCLGGSHKHESSGTRQPRSTPGSAQTHLCLPMSSAEVSPSSPESSPTGIQSSTHSLRSYDHPFTCPHPSTPPPLHLFPLPIHLPSIHPSIYPLYPAI